MTAPGEDGEAPDHAHGLDRGGAVDDVVLAQWSAVWPMRS